ncbi:MAG: ABC transporter ATP-binding protein [Armatimonadota bacterium]|nr:ABC transporter ATP-binding protein [Armatimonadota bacterium]MDR7437209.1 ABC transporter ATP-binding protein [Armatimonadota bacterium]MDR7473009.1 ABC transporter ATP-binding protein [Armatimonadota bacterium]MDR7506193.1 ABC transporter ATP-binding protein [Armatimonadota bacterium]MDR7509102.1 ABC transporter ATP-binding protein [Armatimonadota bacterium]
MSDNVLLSVRDLHTWFELRRWGFLRAGVVRAVDGVSFELRRGEAVAIVGESGCGKSTLARTLLGLHPPTRGEIVFDGRALDGTALRWYRARVGYVQQDPYGALPPFMTARRILEEPLLVNGVASARERLERVRTVLEDVGLTPVDDFLPRYPHMLSGGQQQRLVVARALILRPDLLVADEPVSMLDASVRVEILQLLRALQARYRLGVIYITHDLSTVRYFCERVLVMYAGRIVEDAPVDRLIRSPRHPYTQALLAAIPDPDPDNAARFRDVPPGEPPSLLAPPAGCRFHPRCPRIVRGVCEVRDPAFWEPDPAHRVACWLYAPAVAPVPAAPVPGRRDGDRTG